MSDKSAESTTLRVIVVDDHEVVRLGLHALIERTPGLRVVGEAASAEDAVAKARSVQPDVVLLDVRLPDRSGIDACREIRAICPHTRVLMLTSFADDSAVFDAIRAGASGFLLKATNVRLMLDALSSVGRDESILDPAVTKRFIDRVRALPEESSVPDKPDEPSAFADLSDREREMLPLLADGRSNRDIADALHLSQHTVKWYVSNILRKLELNRREDIRNLIPEWAARVSR